MFILIDCNNFFVSCERVFNPKLRNLPVVVLSNNDGCVIARSNEAKKLGISMGESAFHKKIFFERNKVAVFSSNFALYGDMSERVMSTLSTFEFPMEIYSIDEVFLEVPDNYDSLSAPSSALALKENQKQIETTSSFFTLGNLIQKKVLQWTGIPVSVGIGPTKTLAKLASKLAKKATGGIFVVEKEEENSLLETLTPDKNPLNRGLNTLSLEEIPEKLYAASALQNFPIESIWGIGRKKAAFLRSYGIHDALSFAVLKDSWIKKNLQVTGLQTALELRGKSCINLEMTRRSRKSIVCSRSFGSKIDSYSLLLESLCAFASRAAEKLRKEKLETSHIYIYIKGNNSYEFFQTKLPLPTNHTPTVTKVIQSNLKQIYQKGISYKKGGVLLSELTEENSHQKDLFFQEDTAESSKKKKAQLAMDQINQKYQESKVFYAAEGTKKAWRSKREHTSSKYTTSWDELLIIKKNKNN